MKDRWRSIRQGGATTGKVRVRRVGAGVEIDYADGRKAAVVRPAPVRMRVSVSERDDE